MLPGQEDIAVIDRAALTTAWSDMFDAPAPGCCASGMAQLMWLMFSRTDFSGKNSSINLSRRLRAPSPARAGRAHGFSGFGGMEDKDEQAKNPLRDLHA